MKTQTEHTEKAAEQEQEAVREEGLELGVPLSSIYKMSGAASSDEQNPYAHILTNFGNEIGHDFSNVNVYQNAPAANSLGAEAFTEGNSIHLSVAASKYLAAKREDLIRHELVHVVQQRQNRASVSNRMELEKEAENPARYASRLRQPASKRERQRVKQFRYYEITAEEIEKIRQLLAEGKGLEVYKFIQKKIKDNFARTKFLADYKDIGFGLLQTLKAQNAEEEWTEVSNLFYMPAKGIDPASTAALSVFKTEQGILGIEEIALRHGLTLDDLLDVSSMTMTEVERNPDDFVTALENNFSPAGEKDPSMDELISDLRLYSLIDRIERQAQLKDEPLVPAKNKKYTKFIPGYMHGLHQLRTKNSGRKRKEKMPTLAGLLMRPNTDLKQFKLADLNLGEFGEVAHWLNFYGVSFGEGAVIDELVLDKVNNKFTIKAKNLPINFLEMANHEGGFYADQINLTDALITLDLKGNTPAPNPKSPFSLFHNSIRNKETSHAEINIYGNLDVHNLRLVSSESTTGIGRLQIPGLHLNYSQDISERKTFNYAKIKNPLFFRTQALTSMLMKGPMLLQPLFFGIMNPFVMNMKEATDKDWLKMHRLKTLLNELKGKPHTAKAFQEALTRLPAAEKVSNPQFMAFDAHRKSYQAAFTDMLSENLKLSLNFEEIRLEHFFMTDNKLTPEQVEKGRLPYIREIVIGKNTTEEDAPEIELETHPLSAEEIEKALISDLRKELSPAAEEKINAIQQATDKLGAYRLLARESHHARSKTKAKHVATVETAAYFEFFRKTDFNVNSSAGHIKGGNMIADNVVPILTEMMASSGMKLTDVTGIENIKYKNLKIGITEHAQGWEVEKDKYNGLSIDLELPQLSAKTIDYNQGGILLQGEDLTMDELTVSVKISFEEMQAKDPYKYSVSAIKIRQAQIANTFFDYPESQLSFSSAKTVADNMVFEMTPEMGTELIKLDIDGIALSDAQVKFGNQQIASEKGEDILLENTSFYQDFSGMRFVIGGFKINGNYADDAFSNVSFGLNQQSDLGKPFFEYQSVGGAYQRFGVRHDGIFTLPEICIKIGDNQYIYAAEAKIEGIAADIELMGDEVFLNEIKIASVYADNYSYSSNERTIQSDKPLKITGLLLENIRLATETTWLAQSSIWDQKNNPDIVLPATDPVYSYSDYRSDLKPTTDNTPLTNDQGLKTDKTVLSNGHLSDKALVKVDSFGLNSLEVNEKALQLKLIIDVFSFNKLTAYNLISGNFGLDELHKMFAYREVEDLNLKGNATKQLGKNQDATFGWDMHTEAGEKLTSVYDAKTNYTTFDNMPVADLWLSKLNFKAGDLNIYSEKNEKFPARVDDVSLKGLRINHTSGEIELDELGIGQISANGLTVKSKSLGWGFEAGIDQRASINEIILKGWKTKLSNPMDFSPQGKKATLDIKSVLIPKISATLEGENDAKGSAATSGSIGKIRYVYNKSGAQSLNIKDLLISDSHFNISENAEFINNFLKQVSAKEVFIELDAAGHKSLLLKDAIIAGYKFTTNNMELQADLHCTGDLRIYEGDYETFVAQMPEAIKSGKTGDRIASKNYNAWLIDAAGCQVKMENLVFIQRTAIDERNDQQKAIDEALGNGINGGPTKKWDFGAENAGGYLNELVQSLENNGKNKRENQATDLSENRDWFQMSAALDHVMGELFIQLGNHSLNINVENGKVDFDQIRLELLKFVKEAIGDFDLPHTEDLQRIAKEILRTINSHGASIAVILTLLAAIVGASFGGPIGALVGAFVMSFAAVLAGEFNLLNIRAIKSMVINLCRDIIAGKDYSDSLHSIIEWVIQHLDIVSDKYGYHLALVINSKDDASQPLLSKVLPLFQLGKWHSKHVNDKENTIELAGMVQHILKNPSRADKAEMDVLDRIRTLREKEDSPSTILYKIYQPAAKETFKVEGLYGMIWGDGYVSGTGELSDVFGGLLSRNMSEDLKVYLMLNHVDITNMSRVIDFLNPEGKIRWLNHDKTKIYTYSAYERTQNQANFGGYDAKLATSTISGFMYTQKGKVMAIGDFQLPHLKLSSGRDPENRNMNKTELSSTFPATVNGFQLAVRNEEKKKSSEEIREKSFESLGVKNPDGEPFYKRVDGDKSWALFEFSELTGIDLTHIFVVDGNFVRIGDPWYLDLMTKERIKWGARIGFVREADDQNNKIENYIGTLYSNGFEQSREFVPFRGKENKK